MNTPLNSTFNNNETINSNLGMVSLLEPRQALANYCSICSVQLKGRSQYEIHINGKKHVYILILNIFYL